MPRPHPSLTKHQRNKQFVQRWLAGESKCSIARSHTPPLSDARVGRIIIRELNREETDRTILERYWSQNASA